MTVIHHSNEHKSLGSLFQKFSTASMAYCDTFKTHRKLLQQYFNPRKYPSYYPLQHKEVLRLVKNIAQDPKNLSRHVKA